MPEFPRRFRDFGIVAEGLQRPPEKIRSFLSSRRVAWQYIGCGVISAVGLGWAVVLALPLLIPLNAGGCGGDGGVRAIRLRGNSQ